MCVFFFLCVKHRFYFFVLVLHVLHQHVQVFTFIVSIMSVSIKTILSGCAC